MKRLLATCVVALLVAGTANAQVRIFLDEVGVPDRAARNDPPGPDPLSYTNPVVDGSGGARLFIYGEFMEENDLWLAINFDITPDGGNTEILGGAVYIGDVRRWTTRSGSGMNGPVFQFRSAWIGDPGPPDGWPGGMWNWDEVEANRRTGTPDAAADVEDVQQYVRAWDSQGGGLGTTILGYVDVSGTSGALWMTVESPIFARLGATPDDFVHFGFGDDPVGTGDIGVRIDLPEATIIVPEPASLMLLGLGALALRRRR